MYSKKRVELDLFAVDNDELLLKYGPVAKARSYATTHYSYISESSNGDCFRSGEAGTILLDMSKYWQNTQRDERITLEQDRYCIKLHGPRFDAVRIRSMLCLPGVEVQLASNEVGLERRSGGSETNEKWVVKIPRSYEYDEWFRKVSSIRQAEKSGGFVVGEGDGSDEVPTVGLWGWRFISKIWTRSR